MNVLLLLAHSIEEYDQVRLLSELGYTVSSIGGYIDPRHPHDPKRPTLDVDRVDTVWDAVQAVPVTEDKPDRLWTAKDDLPDAVVDWADVIIVHHVEWRWIVNNWDKIRDKRVVWRTVGQSSHANEQRMQPYRQDGLEIVRYSPKERNIPNFAGEDAIIRFYKDEDEWTGWDGSGEFITNVTQNMPQRAGFCGYEFYMAATKDLPAQPGGPGSEVMPGGLGELDFAEMQGLLRHARGYLYTGTVPASYTLGFIEAGMTGVPIFSIGPRYFGSPAGHLGYVDQMFEAHEFAWDWSETPQDARRALQALLDDKSLAEAASVTQRATMLDNFSQRVVGNDWRAFLGDPA